MNRDRFPGAARAAGRASTARPASQIVDSAIEAMADWMRSGRRPTTAARSSRRTRPTSCVESTRAACATLLGGDPRGVAFGPSFTALTMRFAADRRARARSRRRDRLHAPGPRLQRAPVGDRGRARGRDRALRRAGPRDARAARRRGRGGALRAHAVGRGHRRVQRRSARVPDLEGIVAAAHAVGARVYVDAVARRRRTAATTCAALGADMIACCAYKWFGPHVAILCGAPGALDELPPGQAHPVARRGAGPLGARHAAVRVARRRPRRREYMLELDFEADPRARGVADGRRAGRASARWTT